MNKIRSILSYISKSKKIVGFFFIAFILSYGIYNMLYAQTIYNNDCWLLIKEENIYQDYGLFQKDDVVRAYNQLQSYCKNEQASSLSKYDTTVEWYMRIMDYLLLIGKNKLLGTADKFGLENDPMGQIYHDREETNKNNLTWELPAKLMEEYNQIRLPNENGNIIWLRYVWSSWLKAKFDKLCDSIYTISADWNIWSRGWAIEAYYNAKYIDCNTEIRTMFTKENNKVNNIIEVNKNNIQNNIALWINKYNNKSANQIIESLQKIKNKYIDSVKKVKSGWETNMCNT